MGYILEGYKVMGKELGQKIVANRANILTGASVVGTVATAVISGKDTAKCMRRLQKEYAVDPAELNLQQKIKMCWKDYIPTALSVVGTSAASIGSNRISAATIAQLGTALVRSKTVADNFKKAATEVIGEKEVQKIEQKEAENRIAQVTPQMIMDAPHFEDPGEQGFLFMEKVTNLLFYSTRDKVENATLRYRAIFEELAPRGAEGFDSPGIEVGVKYKEWLSFIGFGKDITNRSIYSHLGHNKGGKNTFDDSLDYTVKPGATPDGRNTCWVIDWDNDPTDMRTGYYLKKDPYD